MRLEGRWARARLWKSSSCAMVPRRARKTIATAGRAPTSPCRARASALCATSRAIVTCSVLSRAAWPAPTRRRGILFPNAELMACPGLREMDFGDFEGRSAAELKEDARYRAWVDSWCETRCPHGEGKSDFTRRVVAAFREACESECAQGSGRAVFVVHAGTVKALLSELAVPKMGYFDVHTEPGGAWAATWDGRCLRDVRPASGGDAR